MHKLRLNKLALGLLAVLLGLLLSSCAWLSPAERRGYSSLPQNQPTSWEVMPYGPMGN